MNSFSLKSVSRPGDGNSDFRDCSISTELTAKGALDIEQRFECRSHRLAPRYQAGPVPHPSSALVYKHSTAEEDSALAGAGFGDEPGKLRV
jgi:hypothetical protein